MSCRSPPCGYFVLTVTTLMPVARPSLVSDAFIRSTAWGLLSSMAMNTFEAPQARWASWTPVMTWSVHSSITR
jgi:hypothetical protein